MSSRIMTVGAPWKHILTFSLPIFAGAVLQQLYSTVDTIIVGNFTGEGALAAVGTTNSMTFFFLAGAIGFSAGNGVLIAQHFGAGDMDLVKKDAATGIIFLLGLGSISTLAGLVFSRLIYTHFIATPPEILDQTLLYFRIYCTGLFFQFGYNSLAAVLRSVGDSAATLYFLILASLLNICLDLLFVGVCRWGVAGAAAATNISQACAFLAAWIYMHKRYPVFRYTLRTLCFDREAAAGTFKIGWPIALQMAIIALGISAIQRAVNGFGQAMTAAFAVGQRIEMYLHLPCNALMTTLATFTGQNAGAGKMERVRLGARQGLALSIGITLVMAAVIWLFAEEIPALFALGEKAAEYCISYLNAMAFIVVILSLYVPIFGVCQGTRHAIVPTLVALCALSFRVIITYAVKDTAFLGYRVIWWNGLFGFTMGCLLTWGYYLSGLWQRNALGKMPAQK